MVGEQIQKRLKILGLTQKEFAQKLNMATSTLNGYIRETRQVDLETLKVIAMALDVPMSYFFGEEAVQLMPENDISKIINSLKEQLSNEQSLMFDGEVLDKETAVLLLQSLELNGRLIKSTHKN